MVNPAENDLFPENTQNVEDLFKFLENGKQIKFFNLWETIFPSIIKNRSSFKHLTFYSHVYFIVRKMKFPSGTVEKTSTPDDFIDPLDAFKNYLWNNGSYFSSDTEFVPYFVLPFTKNLEKSKMFTDLFKDTWENDFKKRLSKFVEENRNFQERTQIESFLYTDETVKHHDFIHWKTKYTAMLEKFNNLYRDTDEVTGIVYELISVLKKYILGEEVDLKIILNNCYQINPSLFNENSLQSMITNEQNDMKAVEEKNLFFVRDLDFEKIKFDLLNSSVKTKLLIMQALRWGITRSTASESSSLIWLMVNHDILHLMDENSNFVRHMIMPSGIVNTPHPTQQTVSRLITALASSAPGKNYLASCEVVKLFVHTIRHNECVEIDDITTSMIVSTLQKLSWIHCMGELMIEQHLIEWLVEKMSTLKEWSYLFKNCLLLLISLTRYRISYSTCLEINNDMTEFLKKFLSGGYKGSENCESIFWKFCAHLENIITSPEVTAEDWQHRFHTFHSINFEILYQYFNRPTKEEDSSFEPEIDADDPLKVEPNGMMFLRNNYILSVN